MFASLKNFDPVYYFDINTSKMRKEDIDRLRKTLFSKLGEYIILRLSANLSNEKVKELSRVTTPQELIEKFNGWIPNLEERVLHEIESFKKTFKKITKIV